MSQHLVADDLQILPISELSPRPISWLVPGRFAFGQVAIIDGDPDLGKSLLMLDLAARLSTGRSWPDGTAPVEPAGTIYLSAEDGEEDTIHPRLQALGADLGRIFVVWGKNASLQGTVRLPSQIDFLDRALTRTGARLLVIDPVVAFLDRGILSASDEGIRRALAPLARLAQKHQCVIILIRHLNKKVGSRSMYRGGGSIGLVAQCRSAWLVGLEPKEKTIPLLVAGGEPNPGKRCVLAQVKNNNAPLQPSLLYEIVPHESGYPTIRWLGASSHRAEELVAKPAAKILGPRLRACQFLKDFLADGPRTTAEIWAAGFQEQLYERTLRRAREDAKVTAQVVWNDGIRQCYWLLPGQEIPGSDQAKAGDDALEQFLEEYRRAAAGARTPLDLDEDFKFDSGPRPAFPVWQRPSAQRDLVVEGARERRSAEGDPVAEGARERLSAERAQEVECAEDFVKAVPADEPATQDGKTAAAACDSAESPDPDCQPGSNDLDTAQPETQTRFPHALRSTSGRATLFDAPLPLSSEPPEPRQTPPSPGPPPTIPEHARWLWHLARPMPDAA